jgi:hypothetical protein
MCHLDKRFARFQMSLFGVSRQEKCTNCPEQQQRDDNSCYDPPAESQASANLS